MELQQIGEMILQKKQQLARFVHDHRMAGVPLTEEQKQSLKQFEPQILEIRESFIHLFGEALTGHKNPEIAAEKVALWGKKQGESFFLMGVPLDEALKDTSFYREYIWKAVVSGSNRDESFCSRSFFYHFHYRSSSGSGSILV